LPDFAAEDCVAGSALVATLLAGCGTGACGRMHPVQALDGMGWRMRRRRNQSAQQFLVAPPDLGDQVALVELRQDPLDLPGVAADNAERPEVVPDDGADLVDEADQLLGGSRLNLLLPGRHDSAILRQQARPPRLDVRDEQPVLADFRA
jgi:hypothetical protein